MVILGLLPVLAWCHFIKEPLVPKAVQTKPLIQKEFGGRQTFNYWNLPEQPSAELVDECNAALQKPLEFIGGRWGQVSAKDAPRLMYKCTKVPGVFEQVPEELRGIFWMRGNGLPEELASLQNGEWFPEERTYLFPQSPFMWSWALGKPGGAPFNGAAYKEYIHKLLAAITPGLLLGFSLKFDECPGRSMFMPGHVCPTGPTDVNLTYATLQAHMYGNMSKHVTPNAYTLEYDSSGVVPGSLWHRGIYLRNPVLGRCACEFGVSYTLTKIIDNEGDPIEPYFSEWVEYMGEVPLALWGKITDDELKSLLESDQLLAAGKRLKELVCAVLPADPLGWCKAEEVEPSHEQQREMLRF